MALARDVKRPRARVRWGMTGPAPPDVEQQLADLKERLVEEKVKLQQARTVVGVLRLRINDLEQVARVRNATRLATGWEPPRQEAG